MTTALDTPCPTKARRQAELEKEIAAFKGKIQQIPFGQSGLPDTLPLHAQVEKSAAKALGIKRDRPGIVYSKKDVRIVT